MLAFLIFALLSRTIVDVTAHNMAQSIKIKMLLIFHKLLS
jgi:hypothetical protein